MGNQYSDASTGEFDEGGAPADGAAGHNAELAIGGGGGSGGFAPPASQDSQEARVARLESFERLPAAESVPVPGAGGMGQAPSHEIMRDTGPIIGTPPDEAAAIPLGSYPGAKPRHWDGDREPGSAEKTGTVHTRTQSFDAGEMGAPPTCAAARSLALRLPWFSRPLWLRGSPALTRCARVSQPRRTSLRG